MNRLLKALVLTPIFSASVLCQSGQLAPAVREFVKVKAPVVVLRHVRVIDGTGAPPRLDQALIIEAGKIRSVGDASSVAIPAGATLVDLNGYTVIPGLVGMHEHMYYPAPGGQPAMYPEHATSFPRSNRSDRHNRSRQRRPTLSWSTAILPRISKTSKKSKSFSKMESATIQRK